MRKITYTFEGVLKNGKKINNAEDYFDLQEKVWLATEMHYDLLNNVLLPGMVFLDDRGQHYIVRNKKLHPITVEMQ